MLSGERAKYIKKNMTAIYFSYIYHIRLYTFLLKEMYFILVFRSFYEKHIHIIMC